MDYLVPIVILGYHGKSTRSYGNAMGCPNWFLGFPNNVYVQTNM